MGSKYHEENADSHALAQDAIREYIGNHARTLTNAELAGLVDKLEDHARSEKYHTGKLAEEEAKEQERARTEAEAVDAELETVSEIQTEGETQHA